MSETEETKDAGDAQTLRLTFHQLLHAGDSRAVNGENGPNSLRQINVIRQGAGEVCEQGVKRPKSVVGDGVHNPFKIAVSIAVETDLLGFFLGAQSLQGPGSVQAAVGAVCRARQAVRT